MTLGVKRLCHLSRASSMSLRSGFRNHFIISPFCSNTLIISILLFQILWIVRLTKLNSTFIHVRSPLPPFSTVRITLTFPSTLKTFLLFATVAMLTRCQSPVNCRGRKIEGSTSHSHRYCRHFRTLQFISITRKPTAFVCSRMRGVGESPK